MLVRNSMLLFKTKIFSPTIRVFPLSLLHFHTTCVCIQRNKVWYNFLSLQLCWMYMWSISKCDALCLSTFVAASFSTWLLLAVESCYRLIGDEKCVQKLTDKIENSKFAYDNNFILHYSEHNCVHSFYSYSFVYLWCCVNSLRFSRLRLSFYMYRTCV